MLYLILFLYQTTTVKAYAKSREELYLILFLYQTTTKETAIGMPNMLYLILFLYQTTTFSAESQCKGTLYLILFLYQTTTGINAAFNKWSCILFCSYIKPQLELLRRNSMYVVSYSVPISNHNHLSGNPRISVLYLILFLYQTTTVSLFYPGS